MCCIYIAAEVQSSSWASDNIEESTVRDHFFLYAGILSIFIGLGCCALAEKERLHHLSHLLENYK